MGKFSEDLLTMLYEEDHHRLTVSTQASSKALQLLKRTIYGTNGPKYVHLGQEKKIPHFSSPLFFDLWEADTLVGTYCLSERFVNTSVGMTKSYYGRYLTVDPQYNSQGYGKLLKTKAIEYIEQANPQPYLLYSYIEESNQHSLKISDKAGFVSLGRLLALVFSRIYPKKDRRFARLTVEELNPMLDLLANTYQDYVLVNFDKVFYEQNYFVLKEQGEIIAGVQANPVVWKIVDMPGLSGKMIMNVVPRIPIVKRLINPEKYQFAALEAIYVKPGRENEVFTLLESVLAHFEYTSTFIMLDENAPLCEFLKESGRLGIMNALKSRIYSLIVAKSSGLDIKSCENYYLTASLYLFF